MKRRLALRAVGAATMAAAAGAWITPAQARMPGMPLVEVWRSPSCGCCEGWIDHMRGAGFPVKVYPVDDPSAARARLGMPEQYGSCHTARVAGYLVEGHVPAEDVLRLLRDRPDDALGLAVPGMPVGSPGMEMGPRVEPYEVLLIQRDGTARVQARYPKAGAGVKATP